MTQQHDPLKTIAGVSAGTEAALHARLEVRAQREGLLELSYRTLDSPVGPLLLASTEAGLVRVSYEVEGFDAVLQTLAERVSVRMLESNDRLDDVAGQLDEYFAGQRKCFDLRLDMQLSSGYRREVLDHLRTVAYGTTASYADLAQKTTSPKAVRAAATACATNPLPVVIPCHRVVRADGTAGNYLGGVEAKATLLALEARS